MSGISPISTGISSSAAQAVNMETESLQNKLSVKLLKESLAFDQKMVTELLCSLGLGQHIDIVV